MALSGSADGREKGNMPPARFKRMPIAGGAGARFDLIDRLRARIRTIERAPMSAPPAHRDVGGARSACIPASLPSPWTFGVEEIDGALPWNGLGPDGVHEVRPASYRDGWAALGFALALLARRIATLPPGEEGLLLWAFGRAWSREFGRPCGQGLAAMGLDPDRIVMVETRRDADLVWALEEGLKARALNALLGQVELAGWTAGRRLALAAQTHRTPCLIVSSGGPSRRKTSGLGAAFTRWRVTARPSEPPSLDARAPGAPRWRIELERCRWGRGGLVWDVEWSDGADCFRLVAPLADRAVEGREDRAPLRARAV